MAVLEDRDGSGNISIRPTLCAPKAASYKQVWGSRYMGTKVRAQA